VGQFFLVTQLISHGVLKGISKHKQLAIVLAIEATFNLLISLLLVNDFGIVGVALGTTIPLLIVNIFLVPLLTVRAINTVFFDHFYQTVLKPLILGLIVLWLFSDVPVSKSYLSIILNSFFICVAYWVAGFLLILDASQKQELISTLSFSKKSH